jgi:sarcosine oxidase
MTPSAPGLKLGGHHEPTDDPEILRRGVADADQNPARQFLQRYIPEGDGPVLSMQACMYTNSPDDHFIIDRHPRHPNVTLACGFSGHGFKFSPVIGEILSELACENKTTLPIDFLSLKRFGGEK